MDLIEDMEIAESTKVNYRTKYKKILSLGIDYKDDQMSIIEKIRQTESKCIPDYINICIVLRRAIDLDNTILIEYRMEVSYETRSKQTETNLSNLKNGMPTVKDLFDYTENLYNQKEWKKYIINYLLLKFHCRNKDLFLEIIEDEKDVQADNNYLIIESDRIEFIRDNYKTVSKYGAKMDYITDKSFHYAVKQLGPGPLFNNIDSIHQLVQNATYNKLGQGRYTKIFMSEAKFNDLLSISYTRGTSADVLLRDYYMDREYY